MKSVNPRAFVAVALVLAAVGAGAGIERALDDDADERARLAMEVSDLRAREQLLTLERDRLRAERNRLEARLAAGEIPPICPTRYVSTAEAGLPAPFVFDYPCSWHVIQDSVERIETPEREGLQVAITLVAQFPIGLVPREGPLAEIEVADWSARGEADDLPPLERWIADERETFDEPPRERRFEGGAGITITELAGRRILFDRPTPVTTVIWAYVDPLSGARHIVQATSIAPSPRTLAALDRVARSFALRRI